MPRYLVERSFPQGLGLPQNAEGAQVCINVALATEPTSIPFRDRIPVVSAVTLGAGPPPVG